MLIYVWHSEIIIIKLKWVAQNDLKICPGPRIGAEGSRGLLEPVTGQICKVEHTLKCLINCKYWLLAGNVVMRLSKFNISNLPGWAPRILFFSFSAGSRGLRPAILARDLVDWPKIDLAVARAAFALPPPNLRNLVGSVQGAAQARPDVPLFALNPCNFD